MKHLHHGLVGVVVVITALAALPARPCSFIARDLINTPLPFAGRQLPRNAELRAPNVEAALDGALTAPDGSRSTVTWVAADEGFIAALTVELTPGAWVLLANGDEASIDVPFEVIDVVDTEPPPPPLVTATSRTGGNSPVDNFFGSCGGRDWPTTFTTLSLDGTVDADEIASLQVLPSAKRLTLVDGLTDVFVDDGNVQVVAIDFAGNVSDPAPIQQAGGCSCNSNDAPVTFTSLIVLGLLSVRRRRQ